MPAARRLPLRPVLVRNCHPIGDVQGREVEYTFDACSVVSPGSGARATCAAASATASSAGSNRIDPAGVGFATGNLLLKGGAIPFAPDHLDASAYERKTR